MWLALSQGCAALNVLHHSVSFIRPRLTLFYMWMYVWVVTLKTGLAVTFCKASPSPQHYLKHERRKMSLRLFQAVCVQLLSAGTLNSHCSVVLITQ